MFMLQIQWALRKVFKWHSSNKWRVIAPVELLQCFFNLTTERYAMLAGQQQDALECFKLFPRDSQSLSWGVGGAGKQAALVAREGLVNSVAGLDRLRTLDPAPMVGKLRALYG